jgi:hypothetical protein
MHALRLLDSQFMKILIPSLQAGRQAAAAAALPHLYVLQLLSTARTYKCTSRMDITRHR